MTNEQLDEIEKLAEAATPGPWATEGESWEEVEGEVDYQPMPRPYTLVGPNGRSIWSSGGGEYAYPDDVTAAFIIAMREYALPLVKAVQAAREEYERSQAEWHSTAVRAIRECSRMTKERDEARAEIAALKAEYRPADEIRAQLLAEMEAHAETKAEVKRLREAVRQVHALADEAVVGTAVGAYLRMTEIHKITKGMVE